MNLFSEPNILDAELVIIEATAVSRCRGAPATRARHVGDRIAQGQILRPQLLVLRSQVRVIVPLVLRLLAQSINHQS
jgi:hypothetical protein